MSKEKRMIDERSEYDVEPDGQIRTIIHAVGDEIIKNLPEVKFATDEQLVILLNRYGSIFGLNHIAWLGTTWVGTVEFYARRACRNKMAFFTESDYPQRFTDFFAHVPRFLDPCHTPEVQESVHATAHILKQIEQACRSGLRGLVMLAIIERVSVPVSSLMNDATKRLSIADNGYIAACSMGRPEELAQAAHYEFRFLETTYCGEELLLIKALYKNIFTL